MVKEESRTRKLPASDQLFTGLGIGLLALAILVRIRLLDVPLERDEGEFAYFGQLLLKGIPPYLHAYSMKFPGMFGAFAVIMAAFGQSPKAIHTGLLIVNLLSAYLLYRLSKQLFNSLTGLLTAALFSIMAVAPSVLGMAAHATHFVVLFVLAGMVILLERPSGMIAALSAGMSSGMAILMKQHAAILLPFLLWLLASGCRQQERSPIRQTALFATGFFFVLLTAVAILYAEGVFDAFWFWTITYARIYVSGISAVDAIDAISSGLELVMIPLVGLWLLAAYGVSVSLRTRHEFSHRFVLVLSFFSFLSLFPGLYFRQHYFILLLPAAALSAAVAINALRTIDPDFPGLPVYPVIPVLVIALTLFSNYDYFFSWSPREVSRKLYRPNPFPESQQIADYIRTHSGQHATISVLGSEPQIYFYADRLSASGHIYLYPLMENHRFSKQMQAQLISDIESRKPEFIVLVRVTTSWLMDHHSDQTILEWQKKGYIRHNYEKVGVVDVGSEPTRSYWGQDILHYKQTFGNYIYIYKKRRNNAGTLVSHGATSRISIAEENQIVYDGETGACIARHLLHSGIQQS